MTAAMPAVDEQTEFTFDQLSDSAKEYARERYREAGPDDEWWDFIFDDVAIIAPMLGFEIEIIRRNLPNGEHFDYPAIWFSVSYTQGDGANFEGTWKPVSDALASLNELMAHAPCDDRLHDIALDMLELSERCNSLIPDTSVEIRAGTSYANSGDARFNVDMPNPEEYDDWNEFQLMAWDAVVVKHGLEFRQFERDFAASARAFMDWIFAQLIAEHEHLTSDEVINEALSHLTFDEDGHQF